MIAEPVDLRALTWEPILSDASEGWRGFESYRVSFAAMIALASMDRPAMAQFMRELLPDDRAGMALIESMETLKGFLIDAGEIAGAVYARAMLALADAAGIDPDDVFEK